MNETKPKGNRRNLRWIIVTIAVIVGIGLGYAVVSGSFAGRNDSIGSTLTFTAAQGPLTISVIESGTIRSRQQEVLKNQVEGRTTIIYLVPEGTFVTKGDLLVELDGSELIEERIEREIRLENAEASYIGAQQNLKVVQNQNESDIAQARLDLRFAIEDKKKYLEGDYLMELREAKNRITIADLEYRRAVDKFNWSDTLFEEKFISESEFEADRLAVEKARLDRELAEESLNLLEKFTYERNIAELESGIEQADMALKRVQLRASADLAQAEAELRAAQAEFTQDKTRLERTLAEIRATKITAPTDGLVVYATSVQGGGWRGNQEPLAEGQEVRERQDLIYLPTATSVMAEVKVHEASLQKVRAGLPVRITVDALPGRSFSGRVARIAPLPDSQSMWANPDLKVYNTEIHIDGDGSELRTGMTCRAEIIVDHYAEATYVPVQSVIRVGQQPVVYVHNGRQAEPRPIELGMDNNRFARIIEGVQPGEQVLLNPPLSEGRAMYEEPSVTPDEVVPTAAAGGGDGVAAMEASAYTDEQMQDQPRQRGERSAEGRGGRENRRPREGDAAGGEQRDRTRRQFENMSEEERRAAMQRFAGSQSTRGQGSRE